MKEICFVNKGENIKKLGYLLGVSDNSQIAQDKILDNRYIELQNGTNDIICVRNYLPYYIKTISEDNTLLDIYASGYEVVGNNNVSLGDKVVIRRITGVRYVVKPMEKLDEIAGNLDVDKQTIIDNNNLKTDKLFVGQILII